MAPDDASSVPPLSRSGAAAPAAGAARLGDHYELFPNETLPGLSSKAAVAVRVTDRRSSADTLAALVCSGDVVPRVEAMVALRGLSKPGMVALQDYGPVDWADGRQRLVAIHTAPKGGRFVLASPLAPWQVIDAFLRPVSQALAEIHGRAVIHRAIRPDNLYLREPGALAMVLGPSVAAPPGFEQPEIYEPLETAAADPTGRSDGSVRHDLFALGMTALALLLGREPGAGLDRDELMIRRYELGSLAAVIDPGDVPPEILDPLQGLLTDAASERWTLKDLASWLKGGRADPPRVRPPALAAKPLTVGGKQVRCARSLAHMIGRNWSEGAKLCRTPELRAWLRNDAADGAAAMLLEHALAERDSEDGGFDSDVMTAARAVMALDPLGPIRFCGAGVDPFGLGPFLFDATAHPEKLEIAISLIDQGLPQKLLDRRPTDRRRATRQAINFERLRRWITSPQPWEGVDRCLYDLNPLLPCRSAIAAGKWLASAKDLVLALDQIALSRADAELKIDTAAAAFLAARCEVDGYTLLALMTPSAVDEDALLDAIRLFGELQQMLERMPLPGIARWCGKLAHRVAESIHHRPTREDMLKAIDAAVPAGNVAALLKVLDVPGLKDRDKLGFDTAKTAWERLESEIWATEREAEMRRINAWRRGRDNVPLAAGAGSMLAFLTTLFLDTPR